MLESFSFSRNMYLTIQLACSFLASNRSLLELWLAFALLYYDITTIIWVMNNGTSFSCWILVSLVFFFFLFFIWLNNLWFRHKFDVTQSIERRHDGVAQIAQDSIHQSRTKCFIKKSIRYWFNGVLISGNWVVLQSKRYIVDSRILCTCMWAEENVLSLTLVWFEYYT